MTAILDRVRAGLRDRAAGTTAPDVTVGDRVVFVALDHPAHGRLAGLAHRPTDAGADADGRADVAAVRSPPLPARPASASDAAALATGSDPLGRAVGVATLNALSVPDVDWRVGDPMAALAPDVDVVATVGLFRPAFVKFDDVTVRVIERDPPSADAVEAPPDVTVTTHSPADRAAAVADADVCFVTGSTLVYGGVDRYLDALSSAGVSPVVLVGATASHRPGPAFESGVDVVAGARIDDPERVRRRVVAGDCGTDLHDHGVTKVFAARAVPLPGLRLARAGREDAAPTDSGDRTTNTERHR